MVLKEAARQGSGSRSCAGNTVFRIPRSINKWWARYAGLEVSDVKELRQLEDENRRSKQMVAEQALDIQALKAVVLTSHMDKNIHAYPSDYWRFPPREFAALLASFPVKFVGFQNRSEQRGNVFSVALRESSSGHVHTSKNLPCSIGSIASLLDKTLPLTKNDPASSPSLALAVVRIQVSFEALRDEYTLGWHTIPAGGNPGG